MALRIADALAAGARRVSSGQALQPGQEAGEAKGLLEQLVRMLIIFEVFTAIMLHDSKQLTIGTSSLTALKPKRDWPVSAR